MEINLSVRGMVRLLFTVLIVLFIGSMALHWIGLTTGHWRLGGLALIFNLDTDAGFPSWFNSFILFLLFGVTWLIARHPDPRTACFHGRWKILSVLFLVMSIDEVATVHEALGSALGKLTKVQGYLYFPFVIPGAILAAALFIAFIPLLIRLPRATAYGMVLAGGLYLSGVLVVEAFSANWYYVHRDHGTVYRFLTNIEELLEMTGLIVLIKVLCDYLQSLQTGASPEWRFRLGR